MDARIERHVSVGPASLRAATELRWLFARLATSRAPQLPPICGVGMSDDCVVVTAAVRDGAVPLADLVATTTPAPGVALLIAISLGHAVASLHAIGLAHGRVDVDHLFVARDGSMELVDTGCSWRVMGDEVIMPLAAGDVRDLVSLVQPWLDVAPASLPLVLAHALEGPRCPDIAAVGAAFEDLAASIPIVPLIRSDLLGKWAGAPEVVTMSEQPDPAALSSGRDRTFDPMHGIPGGAPPLRARSSLPRGAHRRMSRRVPLRARRTVLVSVIAGVLSAGIGWGVSVSGTFDGVAEQSHPVSPQPEDTTTSRGRDAPGPDRSSPGHRAEDWASVISNLDRDRHRALAQSPSALGEVVDPLGPAYARDLVVLRARSAAGITVRRGRATIASITVLRSTATQVVLRVTDERASYDLLDRRGHLLGIEPARGRRAWLVTMTERGGVWRIYDTVPV